MKQPIDTVDATPSKRLYLSIIADYDLYTSICELVDNVIDIWDSNQRSHAVKIAISLDDIQQTITMTDNAGGIPQEQLYLVVAPGQTGNIPEKETIGIFGVGTKRAVVALAQNVRISSRSGHGGTYMVEFDDPWLRDDSWSLQRFQVDDIDENATCIELTKLRVRLDETKIANLRQYLGETYSRFLIDAGFQLEVNQQPIVPITFENWAYPPGFKPRHYRGTIGAPDGSTVDVQITAGLTCISSPSGEYGVYIYCNDRLITKANKSYELGFTNGKVGFPHPSISLVRAVVSLKGPAKSMPWTSSKSDVNPNSPIFVVLRDFLIGVLKNYAQVSRKFVGRWQEEVFAYNTGTVEDLSVADFPSAGKSYFPPVPAPRPKFPDRVLAANKAVMDTKPWTSGICDSISATDLILKHKFHQGNRIALIILDSTLEIALKDYLVNESGKYYSEATLTKIFATRHSLELEVQNHTSLPWNLLDYYHDLRNKLTHERVSVSIPDSDISKFKGLVYSALKTLFNLDFDLSE